MSNEIRTSDELGPFITFFQRRYAEEYGEELNGDILHYIFDFVGFMAEEADLTFQTSTYGIQDFNPHLSE